MTIPWVGVIIIFVLLPHLISAAPAAPRTVLGEHNPPAVVISQTAIKKSATAGPVQMEGENPAEINTGRDALQTDAIVCFAVSISCH